MKLGVIFKEVEVIFMEVRSYIYGSLKLYLWILACCVRNGSLIVAPNTCTPEHNENFSTASMDLRY